MAAGKSAPVNAKIFYQYHFLVHLLEGLGEVRTAPDLIFPFCNDSAVYPILTMGINWDRRKANPLKRLRNW